MKRDELDRLWSAFMCDDLDPQQQAGLIRQLEDDSESMSNAIEDVELDSLLRGLAIGGDETERFVASVLRRLDSNAVEPPPRRFPVVPPPRVVTSNDEEPKNGTQYDPIVQQPLPEPTVAPSSPLASAASDTTDASTRIWWTVVAPLAAVTLIAIAIWTMLPADRFAVESESQDATSPVAVPDRSSGQTSIARAGDESAGHDGRIAEDGATHDDGSRVAVSPGDAIGEEVVGSPAASVVADDLDPAAIRGGFAELAGASPDVRWYRPPRREQQGEPLSLLSGHVVFTLASGAEISIEAPAEFEIDSDNSLLLARGRLSAYVPPEAVGFAVDAPAIQIVDLGTRFDAKVSSSGAVALRVHEGSVSVKSTSSDDRSLSDSVIRKDQQKFVDSDGTLLDWKVEVEASVFGELQVSINGQAIPCEDADKLEQVLNDPQADAMRPLRDPETFVGRYVFNGQVQEYDSADQPRAADIVEAELDGLATLARRAMDQQGVFRMKTKQYAYSGLQEQLEARRKIARIYGPRALGGELWPRERIQTRSGDFESLDQLQRDLIDRLDFVDLNRTRRSARGQQQDDEAVTPSDTQAFSEATDADQGREAIDPSVMREDMIQRLREIRRRKEAEAPGARPKPFDHLPDSQSR